VTTVAAPRRPKPLEGPYATSVGPGALGVSPAVSKLVTAQVDALLSSSAAWHQLSPGTQDEIRANLRKIGAYAASLVQEDFAQSERLGQTPVLASATAADEFAPRAASQVAGVTRETLNAVAFPTFVADLIKGTFNAIVDASIQQMEAFGTLIANVAKTVDQFMADNITDNQARDWLAATYPEQFQVVVTRGDDDARGGRDRSGRPPGRAPAGRAGATTPTSARLRVRSSASAQGKPNLRSDLSLPRDVDLDDKTAEEVLVPAARRRLAQQRHELLSTMVLMGINRIVVTSGRIYARMGFYIDASDKGSASSATQFDTSHDMVAGGRFLGFGAESRHSVSYVSSTKKDSSDSIDVGVDLTGEVDLKFKSETFPLERFADMNAITQIQANTANPAANSPQSSTSAPPAATPAPAGP
jgi:hypothetical protein